MNMKVMRLVRDFQFFFVVQNLSCELRAGTAVSNLANNREVKNGAEWCSS